MRTRERVQSAHAKNFRIAVERLAVMRLDSRLFLPFEVCLAHRSRHVRLVSPCQPLTAAEGCRIRVGNGWSEDSALATRNGSAILGPAVAP